jgi:hypothetical protein
VVRRLGRWQQLLIDALAEHETVAVQTVVESLLGRRPSRSELTAAQRAAHLLAQSNRARFSQASPDTPVFAAPSCRQQR